MIRYIKFYPNASDMPCVAEGISLNRVRYENIK